jgi:hypothetical protein
VFSKKQYGLREAIGIAEGLESEYGLHFRFIEE